MKHPYKLLPLIFLCCLFAWGCSDSGTAPAKTTPEEDIAWQDYDAGIKKIKTSGKKGFLHFYTDWCTYCKIMAEKTFSDTKVSRYLNRHFVPIRVNAEKQQDVAKQYDVTRFPSNWFIGEDAESIGNRPGFIPPDLMLSLLKYIHSDSYRQMKFQEFKEQQ